MRIHFNGRNYYFSNLTRIIRERPGEYRVDTEHRGTGWLVSGGKHRGGGSHEWFLVPPDATEKPYLATSAVDAFKLLDKHI